MILAFLTLKRYFNKNAVAFLILGGSFALWAYPFVLSYNTFSVFILSLSIYLIQLGLEKNNAIYYLISGIIIGFGTFFRLPNALFAALYFVVLLHDILEKQLRRIVKDTLTMLAGGISGFVAALAGMVAATGIDNVRKSFAYYFALGTSDGGHGFSGMFETMKKQIGYAVQSQGYFFIAGSFFGVFFFFFFARYLKKGKKSDKVLSIISVLAVGLSVFAVEFFIYTLYKQPFYNMALVLIPLIGVLEVSFWKKDPKLCTVSMMILVIALSKPIGTDNGFLQYITVFFWLMPYLGCITIAIVTRLLKSTGKIVWRSFAATMIVVIGTVTIFYGVKKEAAYVFTTQYGESDYSQMNYHPKNKVFAGVATTQTRGLILDGIDRFFKENNCKDTPILALNNIPAVHLMLDNPNAVKGKCWLDLQSVADEVVFDAVKPEMPKENYPIIIIIRRGDPYNTKFNEKKMAYLMDFCEKEHYQTAVEEDVGDGQGYTILVPPTVSIK